MKKCINYLLMLFFIGALAGAAQGNLLPNGDFSAGEEYWNIELIGDGYIDFDGNTAFMDTGNDGEVSLESDKFGIPTATLDYSFDYAVDRWAGEDLPLFQIRYFDGNLVFVGQENIELPDTGFAWESESGEVTPPENAVYADVRITLAIFEDRKDFDGLVEIDNIVIDADLYISTQPENIFAVAGDDVSFTVEVEAPAGAVVSYQWYKSDDSAIDPENDEQVGTDEATLELFDVTSEDLGWYYCKVTADGDVIYSRAAALTFPGLSAHWTLDAADFVDNDPNYYADISGRGNHAIVDGDPNFVDGIVTGDKDPENMLTDGAVRLTKENGTANLGTWDPAAESGEWSVSVWLKWNETKGPTPWNTVFCKRDGWGFDAMQYTVIVLKDDNWDGGVIMECPDGGWVGTEDGLIEAGQWYHLVVTYADNTVEIYVNGQLEARNANFTKGTKDNATFWIGRNEEANQLFDGVLDDFRVYNYALELTDIYDLYHAETGERFPMPGLLEADLTGDGVVDFVDFSLLASEWLDDNFYPFQTQ